MKIDESKRNHIKKQSHKTIHNIKNRFVFYSHIGIGMGVNMEVRVKFVVLTYKFF